METQSLPKNQIIKNNTEFGEIIHNGLCFSSNFFIAYIVKNDLLQIGFTTQKGYKNKPQRNKLKRIARELWRKSFRNYNLSFKIILIVKIKLLAAHYLLLEQDFNNLLLKIEKSDLDIDNVKKKQC